ncbi:MAG: glycosyltransferase family 2 protein [Armatimonadaceae bacterium]
MSTPRFTIVIPLHRSKAVLPMTLNAIFELENSDWECILVDDGSPDDTIEFARQCTRDDHRFSVLSFPDAHGSACPARNLGAANAHPQSQFIMFLDHDDLLKPNALTDMGQLLLDNPKFVAVHGTADIHDAYDPDYRIGNERWIYRDGKIEPLKPSEPTTFESMATHPHIPAPGTVLCRRAALPQEPLFPDGKLGQLDYDGWLHLLNIGPFLFTEQVVMSKRDIPGNMVSNLKRVRQRILGTRIRTAMRPNISAERRRYLFTAAAAAERRDALNYLRAMLRNRDPRNIRYAASRILMAISLGYISTKLSLRGTEIAR